MRRVTKRETGKGREKACRDGELDAMAGLISHTSFIEHMDKLTSTQDSIQSTSSWFQWGRGNVKEMVEWWEEYFRNATQEKRLSMIYLANDVLQNSRRKGPDFVIEFYKV